MTGKPEICRTLAEIHEAGREAARQMPPLTGPEISKLLALLAPYRDELIRPPAGTEPAA